MSCEVVRGGSVSCDVVGSMSCEVVGGMYCGEVVRGGGVSSEG